MPLTIKDYADSFNRLDAGAIVGAYRFPLSVMTDKETLCFSSPDEFLPAINRLLQIYRIHGFSHAKIKSETTTNALNGIRLIDVEWELFDKKDDLILSFEHTYIQNTNEKDRPFIAAISHNEMSRWQTKMARSPEKAKAK